MQFLENTNTESCHVRVMWLLQQNRLSKQTHQNMVATKQKAQSTSTQTKSCTINDIRCIL